MSNAAAEDGLLVPIPTVPVKIGDAMGAFELIAVAFAVILAVLDVILLVRTNSAALAVAASEAIAVVFAVILAVLEVTLVFKTVRSLVFAFRLILLDKLVVSIVTLVVVVVVPPLEKL